ncbi:multiple sugar transport system permease protein [Hydrogenispora ethanolica]|uniref:Multiple sugar transport system permease protein n=1 Tax=Hydrogenispora ethanolica TaxID=1082276 RepID=A0A4R1RU75_HYDET|nr:carbohydrate ABC transporter permease [Hydrogenispora ethanolica]TCL70016.1 multiple sugar transport system permease protein [Hydrogenispora ethanolica]
MVSGTKQLSKACIYGLLILGAFFAAAPFLWLIRSSFMTLKEIFSMPPQWLPAEPQWLNYGNVFTMLPFGRFFLNTILIVLLNLAGTILSNTIMAYAFARIRFRGRTIMFGLCMATLMLPSAATMIPLFIEWKWLGGLNTFLPLTVPAFFGNAFYIFMLHQFFKTIPMEYDEAAFVDGAGYPQIIFQLIAPMAKPALAVVAIFTFMNSWNDFMGPLLYLNNQDLYTVSLGLKMFLSMFRAEWNTLMAASTLAVLPLVLLFFAAQRYFIEGLTMGGLKG